MDATGTHCPNCGADLEQPGSLVIGTDGWYGFGAHIHPDEDGLIVDFRNLSDFTIEAVRCAECDYALDLDVTSEQEIADMGAVEEAEKPAAPFIAALQAIAALEASAPEYDEWGGDSERAEQWGIAAGRYEAGIIARNALGRPSTTRGEHDAKL